MRFYCVFVGTIVDKFDSCLYSFLFKKEKFRFIKKYNWNSENWLLQLTARRGFWQMEGLHFGRGIMPAPFLQLRWGDSSVHNVQLCSEGLDFSRCCSVGSVNYTTLFPNCLSSTPWIDTLRRMKIAERRRFITWSKRGTGTWAWTHTDRETSDTTRQ